MKVTLINCTPHALETLIFTKGTRLQMAASGLEDIKSWPEEKKMEELKYMLGTIQSSWEFVDYVFLIEGVTRAFTHQLVRHRVGTSFAQQAQRAVDMGGFEFETGDSIMIDATRREVYETIMAGIDGGYQKLISLGANKQDARGVLPTNIHTNIVFKANLRTLHDMGLKRLCVKAQGEFQNMFRLLVAEVNRAHPWTEPMIRVQCAWNGTCLFPTFPTSDCPVKAHVYDPTTGEAYGGGRPKTINAIHEVWSANRAEAQPEVKQKVETGRRWNYLWDLGNRLIMTGDEHWKEKLARENTEWCSPPMQDMEMYGLTAALARLPQGEPDLYSICGNCQRPYGDHHQNGNFCPLGDTAEFSNPGPGVYSNMSTFAYRKALPADTKPSKGCQILPDWTEHC